MKKIIIFLVLILALPVLLKAQYGGGNGRGDVSVSITNIVLSVQLVASELPTTYDLKQNYPNPFNPTTVIRFSLSNGLAVRTSGNDNVVLKLFDIMGREVATLVNEQLAPGTYEATFDGSALSSGTYFYKLKSGDFSQTKRLTLLK